MWEGQWDSHKCFRTTIDWWQRTEPSVHAAETCPDSW